MSQPSVTPTAVDHGPTRSERIAKRIMVVALLLLAVSLLGAVIKLPYAIEYPGAMTDTIGTSAETQTVQVSGARTYPTEGSLYFTTVSVLGGPERHVSVWEWVGGHLDPDAEVVPEELVYGDVSTDDEVREANEAQMTGSQQSAIAVGLRSTGETVGQENLVAQVGEDLPADGVLEPEDVIVAVDGQELSRVDEIVGAISDRSVGDEVEIEVERDGQERTETLTTADIGTGRAGIGIAIEPAYDLPFEVIIDAGEVGGPSAGMMFALAVHDVLTPGALTGGEEIAGTGTISDSGQVGRIGGIDQKMTGAQDGGADYFLAPAGNCEDVVGNEPDDLEVVAVEDFEDALSAVEAIADGRTEDLPRC